MLADLETGFADPVLDAQSVFRAIMQALANPGQAQNLPTPHSIRCALSPEMVSILLTLSDHDTTLMCAGALSRDDHLRALIQFHTGAVIVDDPARANFAFVAGAEDLPQLDQFNLGTQDYPDRSTTVVLAVPALNGGPELILRGPGIKDHAHIAPLGLPADFVRQWATNRKLFPRGIDLLLVAEGRVMGLPRSTRISEGH